MLPYTELGTFSFSYRSLGVNGMGISASSNFAVLYEASQQYLKKGAPLCREEVATAALRFERRLAMGLAVSADDVYPITFGDVLKVHTSPNTPNGKQDSEGNVRVETIPHDPRWIAEHVVVAFNPIGERHDIPGLLKKLVSHQDAVTYVEQFSELASDAGTAIAKTEISDLAEAMNSYRKAFDTWTEGAYLRAVNQIAGKLLDQLPLKVLGWKPPGGGASESLIVLSPDVKSRDAVIQFFQTEKWCALPAYVMSGICGEFVKVNGDVRITAGHRLDFIGAADLGQDAAIRRAGCCCSCAIEPRTEIVLSSSPRAPQNYCGTASFSLSPT